VVEKFDHPISEETDTKMTQETIPYLHGNTMIGGVRGGAILFNGMTAFTDTNGMLVVTDSKGQLVPQAVVNDKMLRQIADVSAKQQGWRPPSWWFDAGLEDAKRPSHYAGYLPVSLVKERLLNWQALDGNIKVSLMLDVPNPNVEGDVPVYTQVPVEFPVSIYKSVIREDKLRELYQSWWETGKVDQDALNAVVLGMHSDEYQQHQLDQTFVTDTANIVGAAGGELGITSALILRGGRVASMEISIPEELHNDKIGFSFRPNLVVSTSFNGTLPTSWTRTITATVCDNTLQYALSQAGDTGKYKVRHTKNSIAHIRDAVQALGLIHQQAEAFDETIQGWAETEVTEKHFNTWLDEMYPVPDVKVDVILSEAGEKIGEKTKTNSQSLILNKRDRLIQMWDSDPRVIGPEKQWAHSKLAMAQLVNTFSHHEQMVKGVKNFGGNRVQARVEANAFKVLKADRNGESEFAKTDRLALEKLDLILAADEAVKVPVSKGRKATTK
jgi:phage/plasmid-like protein (TIGR03299 family)